MKQLELKFVNQEGKTVTYTLDKPIEPVDTAAVHQAMDEIISRNAFTSTGGNIVEKKSARVVERSVEEIDLGI
ncbi:hypothetical protein JNUCC1_00501 [Lentibacillus sp. JNUCC-1]|uniref:DUF2922 domain-containing protein n=1 Tax=Lentibacillus sp. JNUCC-1 TaxID=2654513 RepID=UPI0012E82D9F|nr:DUF2922 domain-containing protein [Lentibacillus sp. JNUCC-1]MUV36697.1 hypothetical protein [Lentibacillus sp. JNUCC-1]